MKKFIQKHPIITLLIVSKLCNLTEHVLQKESNNSSPVVTISHGKYIKYIGERC